MVQAVEASLKRLQTDYVDLYWVHIWDQITPVEEVMRALDDLVRQGKVLYVGISVDPAGAGVPDRVDCELFCNTKTRSLGQIADHEVAPASLN